MYWHSSLPPRLQSRLRSGLLGQLAVHWCDNYVDDCAVACAAVVWSDVGREEAGLSEEDRWVECMQVASGRDTTVRQA